MLAEGKDRCLVTKLMCQDAGQKRMIAPLAGSLPEDRRHNEKFHEKIEAVIFVLKF